MNRDQKKFLEEKISELHRRVRYEQDEPKEPVDVRKARAVIDAYNERIEKANKLRRDKFNAAITKARRELHFGDAKAVLAMLDDIEAQHIR